jgi:hypothetical protein
VVSAAAQLKRLKFLNLSEGCQLDASVLLQLTALTALTELFCKGDGCSRVLYDRVSVFAVLHGLGMSLLSCLFDYGSLTALVLQLELHWET